MSSRLEDLRGLAQLLDDGKITQREFEVVKTEILEASPEEWVTPEPSVAASNGGARADLNGSAPRADEQDADGPAAETAPSSDPDWLVFVKKIPIVYWAAMGATVVTVLYGGSFTPIAGVTAALGAYALATNKVEDGRWMAWTAVAAGVLFSIVAIFFSGGNQTVDAGPLPPSAPEVLAEIPVGSLGVRFENLEEGWNALDEPPYILKGISITPEAGPLDSFIYRFDGGALLAGAYNPSDDYIYALMGKAGVGHEASTSMYVHLCYLLYPGTQECFDTYVEESGVFGKTADEMADADHSSSWLFDGNEWRLEIADEVQTLRVLGPQQPG